MADEKPILCSACHSPLGDPESEVEHPDDPNPPEDAHFKVQIRSDGEERLQCKKTGQLSKPVGPEDDDYPQQEVGGGSSEPTESNQENAEQQKAQPQAPPTEQEPEPSQRRQPESQGNGTVYDIQEEKSQMDILAEVVTNPSYGLSDEQIQEIRAWALDFQGQMPPDSLEEIAKLMSGVQKQTAKLMRERYELKLNNWMRQRTADDGGPGIGISKMGMGMPGGRRSGQDFRSGPSQESLQQVMMEEQSGGGQGEAQEFGSDRSLSGRERRQQRRNKAIEGAMNELAVGTAENISQEAGKGLVRGRNVLFTLLESKAQKDPDWFFEMADRFDIDVGELLEPSERRKQEMAREQQSQQSQADQNVDNALDSVMTGGAPQQNMNQVNNGQQQTPTKTHNNPQTDTNNEEQPMRQETEPLEEDDEQMFEEVFGEGM